MARLRQTDALSCEGKYPHYPATVVAGVYHWLRSDMLLNEEQRIAAKRLASLAVGAVKGKPRTASRTGWIREAYKHIARNLLEEALPSPCVDKDKKRELCMKFIGKGIAEGKDRKHPAVIEFQLDHEIAEEERTA